MTKLEKLEQKARDAVKKTAELTKQVEDLEARAAELDKKAEEAAAAGELERFKALREQAADAKTEIHVKKAMIERLKTPVSAAEAQEAWAEYEKSMKKAISATETEYVKAVNHFKKAYSEKMEVFAEAINTRDRLGALLHEEYIPGIVSGSTLEKFVIPIETLQKVADMSNFYKRMTEDPEKALRYDHIVGRVMAGHL